MAKTPTTKTDVETEEKPKTCFVMMPISDVDGYPPGHFSEVYAQLIEPAVAAAGYSCQLATSTSAAHMIQLDVVTKVATAALCICDLSTNNPNVLFEYGIRQAFDKPTVLIKDDLTRRLFDLSGFRDIEYDHSLRITNTLAAREEIQKAIEHTVSGSNDHGQVFSLVKLMKLTKAALPTGEIDAQDARFELLNQKLDRLSRAINPPTPPRPPESTDTGRFKLMLLDSGDIMLSSPSGQLVERINSNSADIPYLAKTYGHAIANKVEDLVRRVNGHNP